ncbi:hypothetical protein JHK87_030405 [Glycine soja]|nr:hypothetical protein JHK87_030405 [Glycine soja]
MRNPRWFSATSALPRRPKRRPVLKQPPISQSLTDFFDPQSPQEAKVAPLLARSNLLITRDIEWANLVLGFEQNKICRNKQFAVVENPGLWNWTFTLKDINGEVLAQIDRDWRGFGFEILTDAGQYVIRFGSSDPSSKIGLASAIEDLEVRRKMTLAERAVTVAFAISLDNDYFSRHGGW